MPNLGAFHWSAARTAKSRGRNLGAAVSAVACGDS